MRLQGSTASTPAAAAGSYARRAGEVTQSGFYRYFGARGTPPQTVEVVAMTHPIVVRFGTKLVPLGTLPGRFEGPLPD